METVNGADGAGSQIAGSVSAVNGMIALEKGADVRGRVENVNGSMTLASAHVADGLETTNGNIKVGPGSRVEGGILVEKPRGSWVGHHKPPNIVIGPDAIVQGPLQFEHEVELYVSDRAQIGPCLVLPRYPSPANNPLGGARAEKETVAE